MSVTSDRPTNGSSEGRVAAPGRRSRWLRWALLGGLQLIALGTAVAFIATYQGRAHEASVRPGTGPTPQFAHSFTFPMTVTAVPVGRGSTRAAAAVATSVQKSLSSFYSSAFLDPAAWTGRLPSDAWDVFAPAARAGAQAALSSFTLAGSNAPLDRLEATHPSLSVRVLLDASGRPQAALALFDFEGAGTLAGGEPVQVSASGQMLFRPVNGRWLIVGFPQARVQVTAPAEVVSPSPSVSPSPEVSSSPGPGTSP